MRPAWRVLQNAREGGTVEMARNVHNILDDLHSGLNELKDYLSHLGSMFGGEKADPEGRKAIRRRRRRATPRRAAAPPAGKRRGTRKTTRRISAASRARLVEQGRYMGLIRTLTATQKAEIKKVRQE